MVYSNIPNENTSHQNVLKYNNTWQIEVPFFYFPPYNVSQNEKKDGGTYKISQKSVLFFFLIKTNSKIIK